MDRVEIESKIKEELQLVLGYEIAQINNSHGLEDDLGADSIDRVELAMSLEEIFNLDISDADWEGIKTVQDLINYVWDKQSSQKG